MSIGPKEGRGLLTGGQSGEGESADTCPPCGDFQLHSLLLGAGWAERGPLPTGQFLRGPATATLLGEAWPPGTCPSTLLPPPQLPHRSIPDDSKGAEPQGSGLDHFPGADLQGPRCRPFFFLFTGGPAIGAAACAKIQEDEPGEEHPEMLLLQEGTEEPGPGRYGLPRVCGDGGSPGKGAPARVCCLNPPKDRALSTPHPPVPSHPLVERALD